jgi:chemotaxis response regulator CheB
LTKVLIVDDSALMRKLLGRIFSTEPDFEVQFARDGLEALDLLEVFRPDVVTLDIHMPQMDGLACLDRIMVEHPCPVVMVSSLTAEGAEVTLQALRLGDRLRGQARRRDLAAHRRSDRRIDLQGARCIHLANKVERPPHGARQAPHRPRRTGDPQRRRSTRRQAAAACRR